MSSLHDLSGFNKLKLYYNKNKDKPWHKWLNVKTIFPRPGKQGLVGLMTDENEEHTYVFKISQYINYLTQHELAVMNSLNEISEYCPHFCKGIGGIICDIDPTSRKDGNPFELGTRYPIEKEVLLMEYLKNTYKFYNYIRSSNISDDILYSTIKQTLLAISIAQKKKEFTHYDLHSNNIMMKKCDKNLVFLYVLDDENQFCIPTYGHYPVIIDYGFSFVGDMNGGPLWPTLGHTEVGFMSDRFDPIADTKLFLVTVSGEIHEKRKNKNSKKFLNIVKNIFSKLKIDWESGWDNDIDKSASDYVINLLQKFNDKSQLFTDYDHYCIDILQTLIILPLQSQNYDNIEVSYKAFINEFVKLENEIGTSFYCLYMLKGIVDAARVVHKDYLQKETRQHAVNYFQQAIYERLDTISKYCRPKNIHFEKMLCALFCLIKCMEGILYKHITKRMEKKYKSYKKLPLFTPEQMCAVIDINIQDSYIFNDDSIIMVINCKNNSYHTFTLDENEQAQINELSSISRGNELYTISNKKNL
jgi:hypothetical protein